MSLSRVLVRARVVGGMQSARALSSSKGALSTPFDWEDAFQLKLQLTEEENMIRESVRSFCEKSLAPRVVLANRNEVFDVNIMREMGEAGLLGPTLKGYGCAGLGYVAYGLIANAIENVDSGYRCVRLLAAILLIAY
jgi:glutaryl-CoA dehydrogenase